MGTVAYTDQGPPRTKSPKSLSGDLALILGAFTFSGTYATGGETLDPTTLPGVSEVVQLWAQPKAGFVFSWDGSTKKLVAYYGDNNNANDAAGVEVANGNTDVDGAGAVPFFAFVR